MIETTRIQDAAIEALAEQHGRAHVSEDPDERFRSTGCVVVTVPSGESYRITAGGHRQPAEPIQVDWEEGLR